MSTIAAGTTSTTALVETADTTGNLVLQVNGTTPSLTLNAAGAHGVGSGASYGTNGQVLTSAGSAAAPTWTTPSAGSMTLISTQTASSSASLSWTGLTGYDKYMLVFENLVPASADYLVAQIGTGGTPTFQTSNYIWQGYINANGSSAAFNQPSSGGNTSGFTLVTNNQDYSNAPGASGVIIFSGFNGGTNAYPNALIQSYWMYNAASSFYYLTNGGYFNTANTAVTAIRLKNGTQNISTGTASLYGISS